MKSIALSDDDDDFPTRTDQHDPLFLEGDGLMRSAPDRTVRAWDKYIGLRNQFVDLADAALPARGLRTLDNVELWGLARRAAAAHDEETLRELRRLSRKHGVDHFDDPNSNWKACFAPLLEEKARFYEHALRAPPSSSVSHPRPEDEFDAFGLPVAPIGPVSNERVDSLTARKLASILATYRKHHRKEPSASELATLERAAKDFGKQDAESRHRVGERVKLAPYQDPDLAYVRGGRKSERDRCREPVRLPGLLRGPSAAAHANAPLPQERRARRINIDAAVKRVLAVVTDTPGAGVRALMALLHMANGPMQRALAKLEAQGLIEVRGSDRRPTYWPAIKDES